MSTDKTGTATDNLRTSLDTPDSPETPRPRLRHAITTGASRVRAATPPRLRQARGAVKQNPAPTAGVLALVGGVVAALLLRRRVTRARAAQSRSRWVPARFQR